ncbi:hypothetical protein SO694_00023143 [Aureococcus anophagefferens]|uniref:Uncharacterized protein n=1 Tax=Aureococcus anophagefferens TaxID=44056 RepID=A0ABR1FTF9_AURAN
MGAQLSLGIEVINAACAGAALLTLVLVVRRPKAAARAGAPGARRVALEPCEGCVVSGVGLGLPGTGRKALAQTMGKATQIAVAAGLEALKDAGLVADVAGDDRWKLPEALRDGTGVVYATSFPALDAAVAEVGRYGEYLKPSRQSAAALIDALEAKLGGSAATPLDARPTRAAAAAGGHAASPCGSPRKPSADGAPSKTYTFDRKFLFKAVGVAQDLLRAGRCDRVVVISGDDASGDALMPWVGNGFNALGAAGRRARTTRRRPRGPSTTGATAWSSAPRPAL